MSDEWDELNKSCKQAMKDADQLMNEMGSIIEQRSLTEDERRSFKNRFDAAMARQKDATDRMFRIVPTASKATH